MGKLSSSDLLPPGPSCLTRRNQKMVHTRKHELARICRDPWRPMPAPEPGRPQDSTQPPSRQLESNQGLVSFLQQKSHPWSTGCHSSKSTLSTSKPLFLCNTAERDLGLWCLPNIVRFQTCTFINQLKEASISFVRQTFVLYWKSKGCY